MFGKPVDMITHFHQTFRIAGITHSQGAASGRKRNFGNRSRMQAFALTQVIPTRSPVLSGLSMQRICRNNPTSLP